MLLVMIFSTNLKEDPNSFDFIIKYNQQFKLIAMNFGGEEKYNARITTLRKIQ